MSDPFYNPDWWKENMAASLVRKKITARAASGTMPGDSFLIVTEGKVTEPVYFRLLLGELQLSAVKIRIQPGDASDPLRVINTAVREAQEQKRRAKKGTLRLNEPSRFDHVWAVIDTDVATRMGNWNNLSQTANAKGVKLAHSTPCFEFWLLLHVVGFTTRGDLGNGEDAKNALTHALGRDYSTNQETAKETMRSFIEKWPTAIGHAEQVRKHHWTVATPIPANPSTEVDILVRALNDAAPEHLRKL